MPKSKSSKKAKKAKKPAKVAPIPPGFGTVTPYLTIKGATEALEFYKKAFSAKELSRQPTPDGKLMHARIRIGDSIVMMSDEMQGGFAKSPSTVGASTVTLHIYTKNVDKFFQQAVEAGAKATMPVDNQFWGERYGQLEDPFGHHWSISQRIKMSPKEMKEKQEQAMAMFAQGEHPAREEQATVSQQ
jgi:PhnB protein